MIDGNMAALEKYEREVEQDEIVHERFNSAIETQLAEIDNLIAEMNSIASDYEGYDLSHIIEERVRDLL